ncbi:hypothetical protein ALC53_09977 [Atta colombica]|uniref:Uncharacterized protein n=1 Tax=Atta colombica TaxID=520822 RepID=A0A195B4V9_9HYME|nr:hypothetical protein ALC53_09977 [Atta colombica]
MPAGGDRHDGIEPPALDACINGERSRGILNTASLSDRASLQLANSEMNDATRGVDFILRHYFFSSCATNIGVLNEEKFDDRINRTAELNEELGIITRIQEEWLETRARRRTTYSKQNIDLRRETRINTERSIASGDTPSEQIINAPFSRSRERYPEYEITSPPFTRPEPAGIGANFEERILFHLLPRIPRDPTLTRSRRFDYIVNCTIPLSEAGKSPVNQYRARQIINVYSRADFLQSVTARLLTKSAERKHQLNGKMSTTNICVSICHVILKLTQVEMYKTFKNRVL